MAYTGQKLVTGDTITQGWISDTVDGIDMGISAANNAMAVATAANTLATSTNTTVASLINRVEALENNKIKKEIDN